MDGSTLSRKGYGHGQSTDALRAFWKRHSRYLRDVQPAGATSIQLSRRLSGQEFHRQSDPDRRYRARQAGDGVPGPDHRQWIDDFYAAGPDREPTAVEG